MPPAVKTRLVVSRDSNPKFSVNSPCLDALSLTHAALNSEWCLWKGKDVPPLTPRSSVTRIVVQRSDATGTVGICPTL